MIYDLTIRAWAGSNPTKLIQRKFTRNAIPREGEGMSFAGPPGVRPIVAHFVDHTEVDGYMNTATITAEPLSLDHFHLLLQAGWEEETNH